MGLRVSDGRRTQCGQAMKRLSLLLIVSTFAVAQHHDSAEKPVTLYKGLGIWSHPIRTSKPEAQKYFDQGLALLYGFNRYEALRSFRKVAELEPNSVMAYWGMAMSWGPYVNMDGEPTYDIKESCAAVERGKKITDAPAQESAYLAAAATRCPEYK